MIKVLYLLSIAIFFSCKKQVNPTEPWNKINLKATVGNTVVSSPAGISRYWSTNVSFDKEIYDSVFVVVQWDAFAAPGSYIGTIKDTIKLAPQKENTVGKISNTLYQVPWTSQDVKIVYAWSKIWDKYEFHY